MSRTTLLFVAAPIIVAVIGYTAFVLLGAWIDGRRQAIREKGLHPTTTSDGNVEAREYGNEDKERS